MSRLDSKLLRVVGAAVALAACDDDGPDPAPPAPPPEVTGQDFQPQGCDFKVGPREEYIDYIAAKTETAAAPNIRRVRLGLGGNVAVGAAGRADPATTAAFGWQTDDGTLVSEVTWGTAPNPAGWPAENRANGVTWLTPEGVLNGSGDSRMHEAYVCGLTPATTYYYRVGGGPAGAEVWSDVYSFTTTPSDPDAEVTIALSGDSRGQDFDAWRLIQRRVMAENATLQLFSGDMIQFATDQAEWEKWLDLAWKDADGSLLSLGQVLTLAAHGNHEAHSSLFFGNLVLPQDRGTYSKYSELFFSVDVGPVHIVVLDDAWIGSPATDPDFAGVLTEWLRADLAAANAKRAEVPWIIAVHHHAPYSSSNHGEDSDVLRGREYFVPLWDEFDVDMDIAGHDHNYERSKPLTGPASEPTIHTSLADGTTYLVCAGAGADAYSAGTSPFTEISRDYKSGGILGFYGILKITKASLTLEAHELRADESDPVFDTITMTK